jgi:cysteinyl-tRNA synthetase
MSAYYLGLPFDLHTGGIDHIPVHHTNEIAQTRAATGQLLSRWWLHGEWLVLKDRKMSKSSGDFITLQSLIDEGYDPLVYRYFTYQAHYRTQLSFSQAAMDAAKSALHNLHAIVAALPQPGGAEPDPAVMTRFRDALRDDLNAPKALAVVWEVARDQTLAPGVRRATLLAMNDLLPMGLETAHLAAPQEEEVAPPEVQALLDRRQAARKARDFATADALRNEIASLGWDVRDTPQGAKLARR